MSPQPQPSQIASDREAPDRGDREGAKKSPYPARSSASSSQSSTPGRPWPDPLPHHCKHIAPAAASEEPTFHHHRRRSADHEAGGQRDLGHLKSSPRHQHHGAGGGGGDGSIFRGAVKSVTTALENSIKWAHSNLNIEESDEGSVPSSSAPSPPRSPHIDRAARTTSSASSDTGLSLPFQNVLASTFDMTMEGSDKKLRKGGKPSLMSLSLLVAFTMLVSACWNAYISTPDPEYLLSARSEIIPNAAAVAALGNGGGAAAAVAALAHPESPDNPIAQGSPPVDDLEDAVIDAVEPSEPDAEKPAPAIAPPQPPPKAVVPPAAPQPKAQNPPAAAAPFEPAPPPPIIPSPVLLPHRVPPQGFEAPAQPPPRPTKVLRNPSTSTFSLLLSLSVVVMLGVLGGRVADKFRQAPMLGMLVSGVLARNLFPSIVLPLPHSWTAQFWTVALSAVVARAGLSLQAASMRANLVPTLMLGSIPILVEAIFLASLVGWVFRLPTEWCFTLAFGVASISPGVVVPLLLNLLDNASWKGSRLPPLLLASTGLDVLVATTCFGVSVAAVFGHKHEQADHEEMVIHASWLARGLEEVIAGVFGGCSLGALSFYLSRVKIAEPVATAVMFVLTTLGMMYGKTHGFPGAASSSVIITWAIIANVWEREAVEVANKRLKLVWKFAEPFLFPLIGASVSLIEIPPKTIFLAMICVAMSVLVRMFTAFCTAWMAGLNVEERIFTCGLLTGKASVQAALSTVTIEAVHSRNLQGTADDARARIVFACMVAAIMIGAPFAASWVAAFGTRVPKVGPSGNGSSVHGGTKGGILGVELSMHELKEDEK